MERGIARLEKRSCSLIQNWFKELPTKKLVTNKRLPNCSLLASCKQTRLYYILNKMTTSVQKIENKMFGTSQRVQKNRCISNKL
jgi:hypothetical protein